MTDGSNLYASPSKALRAAVDRIGGQNATARLLGVAQPNVWRWLKQGKPAPATYVLLLEGATGISRHDLRPDVYGPRDPATPATGTAQ